MTTVSPKGRDASEVRIYIERFESKYKIGDVVYVNDAETGRKRSGTFTLRGQFQSGPYDGWWALQKSGSGIAYREEFKPILDVDIREWLDFNDKIRQPAKVEVAW